MASRTMLQGTNVERRMRLFAFLRTLDDRKIFYELGRYRTSDDTVMVKIAVPGERWEVEFFEDGMIEVEVFRAHRRGIEGPEALDRLWRDFSD